MKYTFFGHACFRLDTGKKKLLFDPFLTDKILPCIPFFLRDSEGHVSLYNHGEDASIPSGMMDVVACLKEAPIL